MTAGKTFSTVVCKTPVPDNEALPMPLEALLVTDTDPEKAWAASGAKATL